MGLHEKIPDRLHGLVKGQQRTAGLFDYPHHIFFAEILQPSKWVATHRQLKSEKHLAIYVGHPFFDIVWQILTNH